MANRNSWQNEGPSGSESDFRDHRYTGDRRSSKTDDARSTIPINRPEIVIELERNPARYFANEVLVGGYKINFDTTQTVKAVECSVIWKTTGKGDQDVGVHFFERRPKSTLTPDQLRRPHRISTVLPQSPLSYSGELIQITWSVRLRVFVDEQQYFEDSDFQLGGVSIAQYEQIEQKN